MNANGEPQEGDPFPEPDKLWRVSFLLRHRRGVYERLIRAADALEAERAAAVADREILETLGSQRLGRHLAAGGAQAGYRRLEPVGRRFLVMAHRGFSGSPWSPAWPSSRP